MADKNFWEHTSLNVIVNVIRTVVFALIGVLLVPFYIDTLGIATYGLIPLATTVTSYIMIISDSLVSACYRYIMISSENSDGEDQLSKVYNTTFFGIGKSLIYLIPFVVLFSLISPYIFNISGTVAFDVQIMFLLILLSTLIVTQSSAVNTLFSIYNKLYIQLTIKLGYSLLQVALVVALFAFGTPSLIYVGASFLISSLFMYALCSFYAKKLIPSLKITRKDYDKDLFKKMSVLGGWNIVEKVGALLFIQATMVIVNIMLGSTVQGSFALVVTMVSMMNTTCFSIVGVLSPLVYKKYMDDGTEVMVDALKRGMRIISVFSAMPIAYVIVFSPLIMGVWIGPGYDHLYDIITIAFVAEVIYCSSLILSDVPAIYLKMNKVSFITILFGIINVLFCVGIIYFTDLGDKGAIISWAVTLIALQISILMYNGKITTGKLSTFIFPAILGHVAFAICYIVMYLISENLSFEISWISLILTFGVLFAVYVVVMFLLIPKKDKEMFSHLLPEPIRKKIEWLL